MPFKTSERADIKRVIDNIKIKVKSDKAIEGLEVQINFLNKEIENSALKIELIHKKRELVTKKITTLSENNFLTELITKLKDNSYENDGTIRKKYGLSVEENSVHGSDSKENSEIEINFFFSKREIFNHLGS